MAIDKCKLITASLLSLTACTGLILASTQTHADNDTAVDNVEITVPVSCTMTGSGQTSHTATLNPGTYSGESGSAYENGIGKTTLTTHCNDNNGFSVYAIGYTGDTDGTNTLIGANTGSTIATKAYESTDTTSNWSMKVNKVDNPTSGDPVTWKPENMTIKNNFTSWHAVPSEYTQVAEYNSTTEPATTDTTLGAKLETTYATYIATNQPADTYQGKVKYVMVHPYNHAAPQKKLYMQEVTNEQLASLMPNEGDSTILYDKRDESDYTIANLAGAYWMTQNLRIQGTISANLSNFEGNDFNVSEYDFKTDGTSGGACDWGTDTTGGLYHVCSHLPDALDITTTGLTAKEIGAWYNYAATSAGTIMGVGNTNPATSDICPSGWHLPSYTNDQSPGTINSIVEFATHSNAFQPVVGGYYLNDSIANPDLGYWWSSTASSGSSGNGRLHLGYISSSTTTYISDGVRYDGRAIRCVR